MAYRPIVQLQPAARQPRRQRRPQHTFYVRHMPFVIQPFCIAPVLPGETLKNLTLQARAVSDPVQNSLTGMWLEYYFFYVKHRDLANASDYTEMMLDLNKDMSPLFTGDHVNTYHRGTALNWTLECLKTVTENYFRDAGDAWNVTNSTVTQNGETMPLAKVAKPGWLDSVIYEGAVPDTALADTGDPLGTAELDVKYRAWEFLRLQGMTQLSYEDYLRTFGVSIPEAAELNKPELIRYVREWSYPTNTVDPQTGVPSSAMSYSIAERADKDRFFKEPGFIFGVTILRPKMYFAHIDGAAVQMMDDAFSWLPALMADDPSTSLKVVLEDAAGTKAGGPLTASIMTDDYVVDIRDLLLYGDQFVNIALGSTAPALISGRVQQVALPSSTLNSDYPGENSIKGVFPLLDDDPITYNTNVYMRQDGIVSLDILGTQMDFTPTTPNR